VVFCALLPHAPILVPAVGGARENDAAFSISAMREAARRAVAMQSDTMVVISPHSPRIPGSLGIWTRERLRGSLKAFGFPNTAIDLPVDGALADEIADLSARRGLRTVSIIEPLLDHGATVPLWFVAEAGWSGSIVVLGFSALGQSTLTALGETIAEAAASTGRRVALIASGDMSHRLAVDGPLGFDPRGLEFDRWVIDTLRRGQYRDLLKVDPELEKAAAQDALDSVLVALGAAGFSAAGAEVLNYEAPFGVGYGVAILYSDGEMPL
jgi:AmmeMemoRadiSam system protein B